MNKCLFMYLLITCRFKYHFSVLKALKTSNCVKVYLQCYDICIGSTNRNRQRILWNRNRNVDCQNTFVGTGDFLQRYVEIICSRGFADQL